MNKFRIPKKITWETGGRAPGFTLLELVIAMTISGVVMAAVYTSYDLQIRASAVQREIARMETNLRGAMYLIKSDIRNAGRNQEMNGILRGNRHSIAESRRYHQNNPDNPEFSLEDGYPGIDLWTVVEGVDMAGVQTTRTGNADENDLQQFRLIRYRLWDSDGNGTRELHRFYERPVGGVNNPVFPNRNTMVADGIENIGFAFAYDIVNNITGANRQDGRLDRAAPPPTAPAGDLGPIIWAADCDGVIGLDTNLDNDLTKTIDERDDGDGDGMIDPVDGGLGFQMTAMENVRAVQIWILGRSIQPISGYTDNNTYQVGARTIQPNRTAGEPGHPPNVRRLLLADSVLVRNRERNDTND